MALTPYADLTALRTWLGLAPDAPDPADATARLRSATIRVAAACNLSPYDTPTGDNVGPLSDATCAQAASWIALGINPDAGGLDSGVVKRTTILDATVERDTTGQAALISAAANALCAEARDILFVTGLLWLPGDFDIADAGLCFAEATEIPSVYSWGAGALSEWPFL